LTGSSWHVGDVGVLHCVCACQPILLNFVTGKKSELGRKKIHVAHGAIMFIAWGVLLPLGILVGRFAKNAKPDVSSALCWAIFWRADARVSVV
jgi:hypothetical protein